MNDLCFIDSIVLKTELFFLKIIGGCAPPNHTLLWLRHYIQFIITVICTF
jgi:hypothetical protein